MSEDWSKLGVGLFIGYLVFGTKTGQRAMRSINLEGELLDMLKKSGITIQVKNTKKAGKSDGGIS